MGRNIGGGNGSVFASESGSVGSWDPGSESNMQSRISSSDNGVLEDSSFHYKGKDDPSGLNLESHAMPI